MGSCVTAASVAWYRLFMRDVSQKTPAGKGGTQSDSEHFNVVGIKTKTRSREAVKRCIEMRRAAVYGDDSSWAIGHDCWLLQPVFSDMFTLWVIDTTCCFFWDKFFDTKELQRKLLSLGFLWSLKNDISKLGQIHVNSMFLATYHQIDTPVWCSSWTLHQSVFLMWTLPLMTWPWNYRPQSPQGRMFSFLLHHQSLNKLLVAFRWMSFTGTHKEWFTGVQTTATREVGTMISKDP